MSFCFLLYAALRLSEMALSCMVVAAAAAAVLSLGDEQLSLPLVETPIDSVTDERLVVYYELLHLVFCLLLFDDALV